MADCFRCGNGEARYCHPCVHELTDTAPEATDEMASQCEDWDLVAAITRVVRAADEAFEKDGGSSRHWVRDQFLPRLNAAGLRVVPSTQHDQGDEQ